MRQRAVEGRNHGRPPRHAGRSSAAAMNPYRRPSRPPMTARVSPGDVVAGRFVIEREAGAGGMGTVYQARDGATGGLVALKLIGSRPSYERDRFERGCRLLAHLDHP